MDRIFPHCQGGLPSWAPDWYRELKRIDPEGDHWCKLMDPGDARPLPEMPWIKWIIRRFDPDSIAKPEVLAGKVGAWRQVRRIEPWLRARPWLADDNCWLEHHNEPTNFGALSSPEKQRATADYGAELTWILWQEYGIKSVGGCLGVGHPEPGDAVRVCAAPMAQLLGSGGLYSFHEYGYPFVLSGNGWWTLRYRRTLEALREAGARRIPPLVITETGIDKLLKGEVGGWQTVNNDPRWYAVQLESYARELDPYVLAAFVFTTTPYHPWESYNFNEPVAWEVLARWRRSA